MPLRVLVAPDKFKGTLTARQAAEAMARGWQQARPRDEITLLPISDGGDGFGAVMSECLRARPQSIWTVDAAHRPICATWWWVAQTRTAVIESANVIGLAMLPHGRFHPFQLDTYGLGAVFGAARRRGADLIIVGIGGSATNDGGFGLAHALGWEFRDRTGGQILEWPRLRKLATVLPPKQTRAGKVIVAVDVQNRLLGAHGATRIYGPQKGLKAREFVPAEHCLRRLATVMRLELGRDHARVPGTGAAGGLGFGLVACCGAKLQPGFALFARQAGLLRQLRSTDLVLTGEGAIDGSTTMGKGVGQLAKLCRARKIPCLGFAGRVERTPGVVKHFSAASGLTEIVPTAVALREPARHLAALVERTAAGWRPS